MEKLSDMPQGPLTPDEFLAWQEDRAFEGRYELYDGRVFEMQAERNQHAVAKLETVFQMRSQLGFNGPSRPYTDGMAVKLPEGSVFEPDAMIRCGEPLGTKVIYIEDPTVIVEVISPSNSRLQVIAKQNSYFSCETIRHVIVIDLKMRTLTHTERGPAPDKFLISLYRGGVVTVDPPGVTLDLDAIFAAVDAA